MWIVEWDTIHALHQVLLKGFIGVKNLIKINIMLLNDKCALNELGGFM